MKNFSWSEVARTYDRNNMRQFDLLLSSICETMPTESSDEMVAHFARTMCALAVVLRSQTGIDLGTLTFPVQKSPLPPSHPVTVLVPLLDMIIENHLPWFAAHEDPDPALPDNLAKLVGAFVWKAYLLLLNTPSENWGTSAFCALKVLSILSTVNHDAVVDALVRGVKDETIRKHVRSED